MCSQNQNMRQLSYISTDRMLLKKKRAAYAQLQLSWQYLSWSSCFYWKGVHLHNSANNMFSVSSFLCQKDLVLSDSIWNIFPIHKPGNAIPFNLKSITFNSLSLLNRMWISKSVGHQKDHPSLVSVNARRTNKTVKTITAAAKEKIKRCEKPFFSWPASSTSFSRFLISKTSESFAARNSLFCTSSSLESLLDRLVSIADQRNPVILHKRIPM